MLLFAVLLAMSPYVSGQNDRVKLSIYYESLCGDSVDFIKNQLAPNYGDIKRYVDLDFIPFGKATHNKLWDEWRFTCQHGPNECNGNMLQACGLEYANSQDDKVNFVNCVMTSKNPATKQTTKRCALSSGIGWNQVSDCYNTRKGRELLAQNGDKTYNVWPTITYVPTIVFNDVYEPNLQVMALRDLKGTVQAIVRS